MYRQDIPAFLLTLVYLSRCLVLGSISPNSCPPQTIAVRVPPYLDAALNGSSTAPACGDNYTFEAPPANWYPGSWYLANSSSSSYRNLSNMQWDLTPVFASCDSNTTKDCARGTVASTMADLSTWAINETSPNNNGARGGGGRPVASVLGYDTPRRLSNTGLGPAWDGVFDIYVAGGQISGYTESWAVVSWGLDAQGMPFMVVHEQMSPSGVPPCLDVWTRKWPGPDEQSLHETLGAIAKLGTAEMTELVDKMGPVKWETQLKGGTPICPEGCMENKARA